MIPVFRPFSGQEEIDAVAKTIRDGWWGMGPRTAEFEARFGESVGAEYCLGTSSGTAALQLALTAAGVEGREVITPALTFVSANHAILQARGRPVFADVDPQTLTMDPAEVERNISPRTAAVIPMDYGGHPAELDEIRAIARKHGVAVVEDAAHACGATYRGRPVGSISDITCFSFQAVKNLAMGEGGAITFSDRSWEGRLRRLRYLGVDRDPSQRSTAAGYAWAYDVDEIGWKSHLSDIPASIGLVQLARLPQTNGRRREIVGQYLEALADLEWLELPLEKSYVRSAWYLFAVRVASRDRFMSHLADRGVASGVHFKPSHLYRPYLEFGGRLPVTDREWPRLVSLPLFPGLTSAEVDQVISAVRSFDP